ncbi:MAG: efflux RND transporter permease subunit [Granulosicoccus sp.]
MNGFIRWITTHPVAANLVIAIVVLAGIVSATGLTQKTFPDFSLEVIQISVVYPGASPTEIEQSIVRPIEDQLSGIDGVDELTSSSVEGRGSVELSLQLGEDVAATLDEVKSEVDRITTFPEDAQAPVVVQASQPERALELTVYGDTSEAALKDTAQRLKDELVRLPGVSFVQLGNTREDQITIEVNRDKLEAYGLSLQEVGDAIAANSLELPAGTLDSATLKIPLRTIGRNFTRNDFEDIVIINDVRGGQVRLSQLATVVDGFESLDLEASFNGKRSVSVNVYRVGSEQVLDLVAQAKAYVEGDFQQTLPAGVDVALWQNDAQDLKNRMDLLVKNAVIGMALVMLCLTLFLDFRLAAWASAGIGVAFIASFIVMGLLDMSINMISLFGFILAIGIVVDNAIVIGENVYKNGEGGLTSMEAAVQGAQRMAVPVIFSALTTVVAFTPLLQLPGILGKFLGDIPKVVIIVLFLSLLQSLLILPRNLSGIDFSPSYRPNIVLRLLSRVRGIIDAGLRRFINGPLDAMLHFSTKRWSIPLAVVVALMILTVGSMRFGYVKFSFFPSIEGSYVTADIEMAKGTTVERTAEVAERIQLAAVQAGKQIDERYGAVYAGSTSEKGATMLPAIEGVQLIVGQGAMISGPNGGPGDSNSAVAHVLVKLTDPELRTFSTAEFETLWREQIGQLAGLKRLNLSAAVVNAGDPIALELSLPDGQDIGPVLDDVYLALESLPGVYDLRDDASQGRLEYTLALKDEARLYGLSLSDLALQVRYAFYGFEAARIQRGDDDVRVFVKLPEYQRSGIEDLLATQIVTRAGERLSLESVAIVSEGSSPSEILRRNGRTITSINGDVDFATLTAQEANTFIKENLVPELSATYPGLIIEFGGEQRTQGDAGAALGKAFAGAMLVIFALLALIFRSYLQPIVVMVAIPLGLIGAVAGHAIIGIPLGLLSIFGIIGLSGVVINNSLVMVDLYNEYLAKGYSTRNAVIEGTKDRFRPILLTSVTTFLGIYPLIMETSVQAQFLVPLAVSIGFGVLFGTVILLLAVPALFIAQAKLFRSYLPAAAATAPIGLSASPA